MTPNPPFFLRLFAVGAIVFLANAGLLVLQLIAGRFLAPFVGTSLETWTSVIAAFLAGIALGNAVGGRIADRGATPRKLTWFLFLGGLAAVWMIALPRLLALQPIPTEVPLGVRIPLLAFALCFPAAFALSLLTPLAIRMGLPDARRTGLVSGMIFALSTLGCLLGNYLTGFALIPMLTLDQIALGAAILLFLVAAVTFAWQGPKPEPIEVPHPAMPLPEPSANGLSLRYAFFAVFLTGFAGMTLELAAARMLAPVFGVSIFTWTGVIGVMLAGTALGNGFGGWLADRVSRHTDKGRAFVAALSLGTASLLSVAIIVLFGMLIQREAFQDWEYLPKILAFTFSLFFLPMFLLGTISPQTIRLAVPDVPNAGRVAGRIYAWSTAGAIAGTLATGYFLISTFGVQATILLSAALPLIAVCALVSPLRDPRALYLLCIAGGALFGGFLVQRKAEAPTAESNYFTIWVTPFEFSEPENQSRDGHSLGLDKLMHSVVDLNDPTFLHYQHEQFQVEAVFAAKDRHPDEQRVLVIGGGGYTFPRCVRTRIPTANVDVVEIDPKVTEVAFRHLGLDSKWGIGIHHLDGRRFLAERAKPGNYHVVCLDAVNDFAVPSHLLTKECNELVKATLTDDGAYLLTVIDDVPNGKLWKAAYRTLKESFAHVELALPKALFDPEHPELLERSAFVLYASMKPLDANRWSEMLDRHTGRGSQMTFVTPEVRNGFLDRDPNRFILTDQFAPTDNLMMELFRKR